ncbi:unnamed protein product [Sphagnum compactum]
MSPCAACKLLRRRCAKGCVFAPYFPPDEPQKFANVHKVFGASNVNKMLKDLPVHQRGDAVSSMVYEANARVRDPVYGCVGAISSLQQQVIHLQSQLTVANAKILSMQMHNQAAHAGPNISEQKLAATYSYEDCSSSGPKFHALQSLFAHLKTDFLSQTFALT